MQKLQKEKQQKRNRRAALITLLVLAAFGLLSIFRVIVANRFVDSADRLTKLQAEEAVLSDENAKLSQSLIFETSLSTIEARATQMGFAPIAKISYIVPDRPLAAKFP